MLGNGNYATHLCASSDNLWECVEYSWEKGRLRLKADVDGEWLGSEYIKEIDVKFCPFCGYEAII